MSTILADTDTVCFGGYPIVNLPEALAVEHLLALMTQSQFSHVTTMNPQILMGCEMDPLLKKWILDSAVIFSDGAGVTWGIRWLLGSKVQRVTGISLVMNLLKRGGFVCVLVGATEDSYNQAMKYVSTHFNSVTFLEGSHGFVSENQWPDLAKRIAKVSPDLVLVGMGFPRQEQFLQVLSQYCCRGVGMGVGGVIDVLSGKTVWAPKWVRWLNLEWLYRGLREPRRFKTWGFMGQFMRWLVKVKQ